MTGLSTSPRVLKAGIVQIDVASGAVRQVIALQYNPERLTRSLQPRASDTPGRGGPLRLRGPAVERYQLEAVLDAADQLEVPASFPAVVADGLQPQLSALELLLHPTTGQLEDRRRLADLGMLEVAPIEAPLALFVWGGRRVAPVRITDLSIVEEAFDPRLNPIRATVTIAMAVLGPDELGARHRGAALHLGYLKVKEELARSAPGRPLDALGLGAVP
ncbi:hypothetical protein ABC347_03675 [Sphingomonas sp. 1P06PA]|uniref:hypothetical protein n=1 Tax=Sphingomonas sp. 1P06PA TaxID=554121 RepID=UPI0039A59D8A